MRDQLPTCCCVLAAAGVAAGGRVPRLSPAPLSGAFPRWPLASLEQGQAEGGEGGDGEALAPALAAAQLQLHPQPPARGAAGAGSQAGSAAGQAHSWGAPGGEGSDAAAGRAEASGGSGGGEREGGEEGEVHEWAAVEGEGPDAQGGCEGYEEEGEGEGALSWEQLGEAYLHVSAANEALRGEVARAQLERDAVLDK